MFRDVTNAAGVIYSGRTWAAAWGDVNGDGLPDLWVTKHNSHAVVANAEDGTLFLNLGSGNFVNATPQQVQYLKKDMHGSAWADFDKDGDQDLAVVHSEQRGLTVFENATFNGVENYLTEVTLSLGFSLRPIILGRNPMWLDYNSDGLLDLYFGADKLSDVQTSVIFRQTPAGSFTNANTEVGLTASAATPLLADLNLDGSQEVIFTRYGALAEIFNTAGATWQNIKGSLFGTIVVPPFDDYVIADFNNDLRPDIYFTRAGYADEVVLRTPQQIRATIAEPPRQEKGFSFETTGNVTFTFSRQDGTIQYDAIRVGSQGLQPITNANRPFFTLSPDNPEHQGIQPHTLANPGVYIGYDTVAGEWDIEVVGRSSGRFGWPSRGFIVDSTAPIQDLRTQGFPLDPSPAADQLLINTLTPRGTTRFVDQSVASGIAGMAIHGSNVAAGDFDNDGDVDIYVDQAGPAFNRPNLLLVNQGNGTFVRVGGADGAPGPNTGTGGAVAVADYDQDGFLDIASANGGAAPPFIPLNDGPLQLFRNLGNANNWVEVRLHGTQSTAEGIGAKVFVTAGGQQQMREAVNGQHVEAQDFHVLHFGLGRSTTIDRLEVRWPSGITTILQNIPGNDILDVIEGQASTGTQKLGFLNDGATWPEAAADSGADDIAAGVLFLADRETPADTNAGLPAPIASVDVSGNGWGDGFAAATDGWLVI